MNDSLGKLNNACSLCPRECGVDRSVQVGRCHVRNDVVIARASLHMWEEPCISGKNGSGTVFFTGCNLGCVYCQNHTISDGNNGIVLTIDELADVLLKLQDMGAHNINLVTPTHFVPQVASALGNAKKRGLRIPVVYNTSGYERVSTLKYLDGLVDIYLPDCKYFSPNISQKYSAAPDYFRCTTAALAEMYRQVGTPKFQSANKLQDPIIEYGSTDNVTIETNSEDSSINTFPLMLRGMIVRHMILPGYTEDSKAILKYLFESYGDNIFISIMNQYTTLENVAKYPEINRRLTQEEYDEVIDYAVDLGITNAFIQDGETAEESFIPDFESFDLQSFMNSRINF